MKISDIIHYPVKSLAGNHLNKSEVHERGLNEDRRLMLIDDNNTFVSQRTIALLSQIEVGISEDFIILKDRRTDEFIQQPLEFELKETKVKIWNDVVGSHHFLDNSLDEWISERMKTKVRFVYMDESNHRPINPKYAKEGEIVSFADGYPILITNTASLAAFNSTLEKAIAMDHFRPNIVIDHTIAWDEDNWKRIKIGEVVLRITKPCERCIITNINPKTGKVEQAVLADLGKIRLKDNKVLFGVNAVAEKTGIIKIEDKVIVID
jgi:uncharacterized protein YcbX